MMDENRTIIVDDMDEMESIVKEGYYERTI